MPRRTASAPSDARATARRRPRPAQHGAPSALQDPARSLSPASLLRTFGALLGLAVGLGCAAAPAPPPQRTAHTIGGVVFHDRDGDGQRSADEPGIAAVAVSDGEHVVRTDARGVWKLPRPAADANATFFVVKPRDWIPPVDAWGRSRFYYLHRPRGSAPLAQIRRVGGLPPTGPLPDSIDFALRARPEPEAFGVIVLADPQPYSLGEVAWLERDVLAGIARGEALFGVTLGDLVGDDAALFAPLDRAIGLLGLPWYNVIGNHDLDYDAPHEALANESFESRYGPATYAFEVARVHFVVLDDVRFLGARRPPEAPLVYEGGISERDFRFLEAYLASIPRDERVVLLMHIPLVGSPVHELRDAERRRLFALLADHPRTLSLSGHTHLQQHFFLGPRHGNPGPVHHHVNAATASGSWWRGAPDEHGIPHATMRCGAPNGHTLLSFDGDAYRVRFVPARRPARAQMHIIAPSRIARGDPAGAGTGGGREILANVYAGSERSQVEMRVGGGAWRPMRRTEGRVDPDFERMHHWERAHRGPGLRPVPPPVASPHLWSAELPPDLPPGTLWIEVRHTDVFGQVDVGRRALHVD